MSVSVPPARERVNVTLAHWPAAQNGANVHLRETR
jgi:hypothetical protein